MPNAAIPLILTRPEDSNQRFMDCLPDKLRASLNIIQSPLIEIVGLSKEITPATRVALFTSMNGVRFAPNGDGRMAYCVGRATARAAEKKGWVAQVKGLNAEELVQTLLAERPADPMTHFHGVHSRGNISERLSKAKMTVRSEVVYDQQEVSLTPAAHRVLGGSDPVIVPLFSPRTAKLLVEQAVPQAPILLAAMSDQVAQAAAPLSAASVCIAPHPTLDAMVNTVEKLFGSASAG